MRTRPFFFVLAAAAGAALLGDASAQTDPLAPAREGQVQCFEPIIERKVCAALASYAFDAGGAIDNRAEVLIFPRPAIVMRLSSPVVVRDGAVCGPLRREDIDRAEFTLDGAQVTGEDTHMMRGQVAEQMAAMLGTEVCTTFTQVEGGLQANAVMNGAPRPDLAQRVIWVRPEEGYRVGQ